VTELIAIGEEPTFLSVSAAAVELEAPKGKVPRLNDVGEAFKAIPVPLKATTWGLKGSESLIDNVSEIGPDTVGCSTTDTWQLLFAARLLPHVVLLTA